MFIVFHFISDLFSFRHFKIFCTMIKYPKGKFIPWWCTDLCCQLEVYCQGFSLVDTAVSVCDRILIRPNETLRLQARFLNNLQQAALLKQT